MLGAIAIITLPVAQFPPISPPVIQVQTTYVGASATVVEQSVASQIENSVVGVDNLIYMQSTSSSSGQYTLNCTFRVGSDIRQALIDVQNRVQQATGKLPDSVNKFGITVQKKSPQILMLVALYSPSNSYDRLYLSNYATLNLINPLLSVPGIGAQGTIGQQNYAMRAWVRPDRLSRLGLTTGDLEKAIDSQNVLIPTGAVGAMPAPPNTPNQLSVNAQGQLTDPKEFGNIIVRTNPDGSIVRLSDVSRVELGAQLYLTLGSYNGRPATLIILYQTPEANALQTAASVRTTMAALAKSFPPSLQYSIAYDSTLFVKTSIRDVIMTLFEAIGLVIVVVFLFLGSFRSSAIPMLAVPVSLIGTFIFFIPFSFSINTLTLFGLVLAIGLVVDDAIVVVEAVEHYIEQGLAPVAACERAMKELSGPIIAISLVLTSVFLPSAFISGITGQLYRQFALTITVAVNLSAIVALSLTPALCGLILRERRPMRGPLGWIVDRFNGAFGRVSSAYGNALQWLLRRSALVIGVLAIFYIADVTIGMRLPSGFVPTEDQGVVFAQVQLPYSSGLQRNANLMDRMQRDISSVPGVQNVISLIGFSLLSSLQSSDLSSFVITLQPWDERIHEHLPLRGIATGYLQEDERVSGGGLVPVRTADGTGPWQHLGLHIRAAGSVGALARRPRGNGRQGRRSGAQASGDYRAQQYDAHVRAAVAARRGSRQERGDRRRSEHGLTRTAGDAGRAGREQFHALQPHMERHDPGRTAVPGDRRQHRVDVRSQQHWTDGPPKRADDGATQRWNGFHPALQYEPRGRDRRLQRLRV